ncbi:pimeloyl-ACP methyl ester carboxylesterase [Pseudomonas sp. SLBN-26]|uniref:alpha/beta fold hydrolase n=1 Tax=Pseudomonadaceae TaxID=135621 RepID=UPI001154AFEF|nr:MULTISPECIES: alpha/beta hydrolase [Pseudomonas]MCP1621018.1 pimeloyl-ACP methyl ester carboxylesterase [Pseudomonas otitidis]TQL10223.1 pimeloyl-ACP methyl ester carboxylesterase [Pseudomonas sp. SLBN-26]
MKKLLAGLVTLLAAVAATLYFYPPALMASARLVETHLAGLSNQVVTAGELDFAYYDGGPKLGETIVMVHGFGADKDNWLRMARHFSSRYHVVVPDLPGFGESSRPAGSYDVGTQAERLADFIQALGVGKVHLVGNSMGGHIVALYAARYPDRVRSLALFDNAGVTAPHKSELFDLLEQGRPNPLVVTRVSDYDRLMDFVFVDPPILPAPLKRYLADRAIANQVHYEAVFQQLVQRYIPLEPELPKIQAPTLLLWGDQDRVLDVSSLDVMKPLIPHASTVVMKDCGHAPMIERPAETARHYQAFLDDLATGTATP